MFRLLLAITLWHFLFEVYIAGKPMNDGRIVGGHTSKGTEDKRDLAFIQIIEKRYYNDRKVEDYDVNGDSKDIAFATVRKNVRSSFLDKPRKLRSEEELPTMPINLAVSNIQAHLVMLQYIPGYNGKASINTWKVEAQINGATQWENIYNHHDPDAYAFEIPHLKPFTKYRFRLTAINVVGASDPSEPSREIETLQDDKFIF
ncbi:protein sidekick-like [Glandiceps talaboti]